MSRRALVALAVALLVAIALVWWWVADRSGAEPEAIPTLAPEQESLGEIELDGPTWQPTLYFPGQDGRLHAEERELPLAEEPVERIAGVVRALLAGPELRVLRPPLPGDTRLLAVEYDAQTATAWVDLGVEDATSRLQAGSKQELLMVFSLVNSVALNVEGVERVGLLWNGSQPTTFAGHVDATRPLAPEPRYLARSG
jgi:hypothetical protein